MVWGCISSASVLGSVYTSMQKNVYKQVQNNIWLNTGPATQNSWTAGALNRTIMEQSLQKLQQLVSSVPDVYSLILKENMMPPNLFGKVELKMYLIWQFLCIMFETNNHQIFRLSWTQFNARKIKRVSTLRDFNLIKLPENVTFSSKQLQ